MDKSNNIKMTIPDDCGNSPKKLILKDFNIAFVSNETDFLSIHISDNITWNIIGDSIIQGKGDFIEKVKEINKNEVIELIVDNIITHGYVASANGKIVIGDTIYNFCHIYNFTGAGKKAKIKEITSFIQPPMANLL